MSTDISTPAAARAATAAVLAHGAAKVVASFFHEARNGVFARGGQRLGRRVTLDAFGHLLNMDAGFFAGSRTGALTRVVDRGTRSVLTLFRSIVFAFLPTAFELILVCALLFKKFDGVYCVVVLAMFVAYITWTMWMAGVLARLRVRMNEIDNETAARATDTLYNAETVSLFNARDVEVERLDGCLVEYESLASRNEWLYSFQNFVQNFIYVAGLTTVLTLGVKSVATGAASVGDVVMMSQLLMQMWFPLQFFGWQYREAAQALVDIGNLFSILDTRSAVVDVPDVELHVPRGEIVFENVSFKYPESASNALSFAKDEEVIDEELEATADEHRAVLKNVSFTIPAGQAVALVGPSGSGKSSALSALCRVYDIQSGRISIDGQDITGVSLESLRQNVSIVPQNSMIWNDTVLFNMRYAKQDASFEDVVAAAKAVALHDTILRMPLGYETVLGEKGVRMSGGEAQRLAAARALLQGAPICAFDEITSALDSRTETEVLKSLSAIRGFKSSITVAHRLGTIVGADLIIVLVNGEIAEQGTHHSLLQIEDGVYADMWRIQSQGSLVGEAELEKEAASAGPV